MPQASEELRQEWMQGTEIGTEKAEQYLKDAGYKLTKGWCWIRPSPEYTVTDKEASAICFLQDEWDYGGWVDSEEEGKSLFVESKSIPSNDSDFSSPWG